MAKILDQFALSPPKWSSPTAVPRYDAYAFAAPGKAQAALGESVARMGKAIGGAIEALGAQDDQAQKYETARKFVDLDMQMSDYFAEQQRNMKPDGEGFRDSIAQRWDADARTFFKDVPDRYKGQYDVALRQRARDYERRARDIEYRRRDEHHIGELTTTATQFLEQIDKDPDSITDNIGRYKFLVENSRLPDQRKIQAYRDFGAAAEARHFRARIAASVDDETGETPEQIRADIENRIRPAWDTSLVRRSRGIMRLGGPDEAAAVGDPADPIVAAARQAGVDPVFMRAVADIESGGDPTRRTGSYKGLFQLSDTQFRKYGGSGDINDPAENARAAAAKFVDLAQGLEARLGREPTSAEVYLAHQQGLAGATAHLTHPDAPAWQNMQRAARSSEAWAKKAVWGNLTPAARRRFGSVDKITSADFAGFWADRVESFENKALDSMGSRPTRMAGRMGIGGPPGDDAGGKDIPTAAGGSVPRGGGSAMEIAKAYLGASERRDADVLSAFFRKSGGQKLNPADTAWCAAFVNAALGASGQKGTGTLRARDFLEFGAPTKTPSKGDIVVLSRGDPNGWQGHVGFYAGKDANGNVLVLGGNQGDKVSVQAFAAARVLGFRRPPEAGEAIPGVTDQPTFRAAATSSGQGQPTARATPRASDFRSAAWLMDSFQWGGTAGGYADMKNPEDAAARSRPARATTQPTSAAGQPKVSEAAPSRLSAQDAYAALVGYEDEATLADLPPQVRAKVLPPDKVGNEQVGNTTVGDVRRLLEGQLPPAEGHATSENVGRPATVVQGRAVATFDSHGRVATILDGIPDETPLSELPEDKRAEVMGLMPKDAEQTRTLPNGQKVSAADMVTVGEVKRAFEAPLQQAQRTGQAPALPPKHTYRWLTQRDADKLLRELQIAQRNRFLMKDHGLIDREVRHIATTGEERRDEHGHTVLDRARKVLTPNQFVQVSQKIAYAKEAFKYIAPIPGLPEHVLASYSDTIASAVGVAPEMEGIKIALLKEADRRIAKVTRERKEDIAHAVRDAPEVRAAMAEAKANRALAMGADGKPIQVDTPARHRAEEWEKLIEARLDVQMRIFDGNESSTRVLTKHDTYRLFGVSGEKEWASLGIDQKIARAQRAAQIADAQFGRYARKAFDDAIKIMMPGDPYRAEAAASRGFMQKMIRGEIITADDVDRFRNLSSLYPMQMFLARESTRLASQIGADNFKGTPIRDRPDGYAVPSPTSQRGFGASPSMMPALGPASSLAVVPPQQQDAGRFAAPALRAQPGRAEQQRWIEPERPNAATLERLLSNPKDQAFREAFDRRYGPGSSQQAIDWWASRRGASGAARAPR